MEFLSFFEGLNFYLQIVWCDCLAAEVKILIVRRTKSQSFCKEGDSEREKNKVLI